MCQESVCIMKNIEIPADQTTALTWPVCSNILGDYGTEFEQRSPQVKLYYETHLDFISFHTIWLYQQTV